MRQYGKAISDVLALDISKSDTAADTALVSCLLFTAFESIQGHYRSAIMHASAGLKILRDQEIGSRKEAYLPRDLVKSAFMQLDTQSREIEDVSLRPIIKLSWRTRPPAATFQTLDQAKEWLEDYTRDLTEFLATIGESLRATPDDLRVVIQKHGEKKELNHSWCLACRHIDAKYARVLDGTPTPAAQGYLIIQLWRTTIKMLLNVELQFGEIGWDNFETDFSTVVLIAQKFIKNSAQLDGTLGLHIECRLPTCKPTISFSIGIVTPLFLTATRCRNPDIRRSACEALRACNRSESMWNSTLAARLSERVIALEEHGLGNVSSASQIPLEARILGMDLAFGPDRQAKVKYYQYSPLAGDSIANCNSFDEELSWGRLPTFTNRA